MVGIVSQLLATGLPAEERQWDRLAGIATAMIGRPGRLVGIVVWDLDAGAVEACFEPVPGPEERELRDIPVLAEQSAEFEDRSDAAGA